MDKLTKEFVDIYNRVGSSMGQAHGPMMTIFARIYIEPEAIAMETVAEEIGYSLASVSNHVKMLEGVGMIKKIKKPGDRKIYVYADKDILKVNKDAIEMKLKAMKSANSLVQNIIVKYAKSSNDLQNEKVKILKKYTVQMKVIEDFLVKGVKELERMSK